MTDRTGAQGRFEVPVQILIRVGLRCVGRQEDEFDSVLLVGQPRADPLGVMHTQVVDDKKDLLSCVLHQPFEELDESFGVDATLDDFEGQLPTHGNRRNPRAEIAEIIDSLSRRVGVLSTGVLPRGA